MTVNEKVKHIKLTTQKVKALPEWAQQRVQGYVDGVADATKKTIEKKSA